MFNWFRNFSRPEVQAPAPATQLAFSLPESVAVAEAAVPAASIYTLFDSKCRFQYAQLFRYNRLSVRNLLNRKGVLTVIRNCSREDFMALPFSRRKAFFALLKQETARYNGTAVRQRDTSAGKRGEPLPQLRFPTPQDAAAYRELLQQAMRRISAHINH